MNQNKIVLINGHRYDAQTGLPLDKPSSPAQAPAKKPTTAAAIHNTTQKSKTLVRRAIKNPVKPVSTLLRKPAGRTMDIARSSKITRFAPSVDKPLIQTTLHKTGPQNIDVPATAHPAVSRALAKTKKPEVAAPSSKAAKIIKDEAIASAMAKSTTKNKKVSLKKRYPRFLSVTGLCLVIIIIAGYITYLNMPNLSVAVAAGQAGIAAKYPDYRPDGYSVDGPVTFSENDGSVTINFKANTGSSKFSFKQTRSSWDSSAVLDNVVRKKVGEEYITSQVGGLTIYTYGGDAAWVNGGILYTIDGNAPLSSDQIRRIATSL